MLLPSVEGQESGKWIVIDSGISDTHFMLVTCMALVSSAMDSLSFFDDLCLVIFISF